jgi:hypothetical protein
MCPSDFDSNNRDIECVKRICVPKGSLLNRQSAEGMIRRSGVEARSHFQLQLKTLVALLISSAGNEMPVMCK